MRRSTSGTGAQRGNMWPLRRAGRRSPYLLPYFLSSVLIAPVERYIRYILSETRLRYWRRLFSDPQSAPIDGARASTRVTLRPAYDEARPPDQCNCEPHKTLADWVRPGATILF